VNSGIFQEAEILVNGHRLTRAEAMTVRVALSHFNADLDDGLGDDEVGLNLARAYRAALTSLFYYIKEKG
jgi:hypothetical protein